MKNNDSDILGVSRLDDEKKGAAQGAPGEKPSNPPLTPTEVRIAAIWQAALPGIPIQRDDNFIVIGGDSLSLAQVIMEIETLYKVSLPVDVIANNLTLQGMSAAVDSLVSDSGKSGTASSAS